MEQKPIGYQSDTRSKQEELFPEELSPKLGLAWLARQGPTCFAEFRNSNTALLSEALVPSTPSHLLLHSPQPEQPAMLRPSLPLARRVAVPPIGRRSAPQWLAPQRLDKLIYRVWELILSSRLERHLSNCYGNDYTEFRRHKKAQSEHES